MPSPLLLPVGNVVLLFFLPHSLWRTTCYGNTFAKCQRCFYPRPSHGGRPDSAVIAIGSMYISTHTLRTEGDPLHPRH